MVEVIIHDFKGWVVRQRSDGYWDGNSLCRVEGIDLEKYLNKPKTKKFLEETWLSNQMSKDDLIQEDTVDDYPVVWMHPLVANHLAGWLGAWVSKWLARKNRQLDDEKLALWSDRREASRQLRMLTESVGALTREFAELKQAVEDMKEEFRRLPHPNSKA